MQDQVQLVLDGVMAVGEKFELFSPRIELASKSGIKGIKSVMDELGKALDEDMIDLQENSLYLKVKSKKIDDYIDVLIQERKVESFVTEQIDGLFRQLKTLSDEVKEIDESYLNEVLMIIRSIGQLSKSFRNHSRVIEDAMTSIFDLVKLPALWQKKIRIVQGEG